jgi:hypothetical protein
MLRYDVSTNTLQVYDSTASEFRTLYAGNGSLEVFPRLGTSATQAATGNHTHTVNQFAARYGTSVSGSATATVGAGVSLDATPSGAAADGINFTAPSSGRVLVQLSGRLQTKNEDKITTLSLGITRGSSHTTGTDVLNPSANNFNTIIMEGFDGTDSYYRFGTSFVQEGLTAGSTHYATFYYSNSDSVSVLVDAYVRITPMP